MPIKQSAKKALRQSQKRRVRNLKKKRRVKDLEKQVRSLVVEKKMAEAKKLLPQYYKALDKVAKTGLIKQNKSSRKKSQITRLLNKSLKTK